MVAMPDDREMSLLQLQRFLPNQPVQDKYGDFKPFPGSIPTFPPGSSQPRYVMPDGSLRPIGLQGR
jgi:hypothetical protein